MSALQQDAFGTTIKEYDIPMPISGPIQEIVDTPQQEGGVDCGVVVLLINKFFQ